MSYSAKAEENFQTLSKNPYPGRGIVLGTSPDGKAFVQVYWIMGRSVNSRNRIFVAEESGFVKTKAFDESKLTDPHLIIYYPARHLDNAHIITNGDQTDTIFDGIRLGGTFESALATREYEDDAPNFTPRISGITYKNAAPYVYQLSILKSDENSEEAGCIRETFGYEKALPGLGHFVSTYVTNGTPIPSFAGVPQWMPIFETAEKTRDAYWNALDKDNKVSLLVKWINRETFEAKTLIVNKLG
ncbi:MAG: IMP cyclohydrolase [Hallerella porci]|uniref:IMP cyclohydrolase-like protein n=1 Tax=Hallerella porci TaxID=1945871 RepID=A0ABX5LTL9_9BACT|nr:MULTISPECIES: IMP cyclohydrolase [Hallerella]MCI5601656.1 IMP cyclohydrolase [Hallerella sp.]MDY3921044.1 IMP cyclohydrolase [Hallerella porci]PWL03795.1 IMP cyclohydrolase-like protein [Hallerella porci]